MSRNLLNFVSFQAGWFSCVLGAANGMPWIGPIVVAAIVIIHLHTSVKASREAMLVFFSILLGLACDGLLVSSGWINYSGTHALPGLAPVWILAMWALFATTLNLSMSWLKTKLVLASVLGAIFGPLSYLAGQRLGAIEIVDFNSAVIALTFIWAFAMPLLTLVAFRFDGISKPRRLVPLAVIPKED